MDSGGVQGLRAAVDPQESSRLLEGLGPYAGDVLELGAVGESTVLVAELNDVERGALGDASHITEESPGGGVKVDTDLVDAAFDGSFERLLELSLVDVVLVLADTD
jgi:hypothetical protein